MSDPTPSIPTPSGGGEGTDWNKILDEQEKDPGFKPVPSDWYRVRIDKAEAVKAGTGADMLKVQAKILGGPYDTKMVFTNIVFSPGNPTAMRFTLRKLKALGLSEEMLRAQNPRPAQIAAMIQGVEVDAEVVLKPATDEYDEQNDIKKFRALGPAGAGGVPPAPTVAGNVPPPPPTSEEIPKPTIPDAPSVPPAAATEAEPATGGAGAPDPEEPF